MPGQAKEIKPGYYEIEHFAGDMMLWGRNDFDKSYPEFENALAPFGVVDSPQQFIEEFGNFLEKDSRSFTIFLTHVAKNPENAGQGGGWRWHKWGPYIGKGKPTTEYLDDEPEFQNGIWVYHIYQVD